MAWRVMGNAKEFIIDFYYPEWAVTKLSFADLFIAVKGNDCYLNTVWRMPTSLSLALP